MNLQNYEILQVSPDATDDEIKASYERLKAKYNEEKWQDGEAGNNAARMLGKLDAAYAEVMEERKERAQNTSGASSFEEVSAAIRSGDLARAQSLLDDFNERSAEWHYLQSIVFYKKNWMNESKKQLEIAIQMDGSNAKYREAYDKLKARADYRQQTGGAPNTNPDPQVSPNGEQMGGSWCANCASWCYTCLCVNCLFNLCCNCN
ncbi:MAG TPA: DnaJ domain-containing protein [Firmicutes bacterium]|nr:DnaJ domain-containing protein [Bacillota bacterium]